MTSKGKVTAKDATTTQKGVSLFADEAESIAGQIDNKFISPKNVNAAISNVLTGFKFSGFKFKKFDTFTVLEPNTIYISTDPPVNPPAEGKLPAIGSAQAGDIIIVYALTASTPFKVTLNDSLILHHDGTIVEDIDGKYLLGDQGGSCVVLGSGGSQQWYSLLHYKMTLTAAL